MAQQSKWKLIWQGDKFLNKLNPTVEKELESFGYSMVNDAKKLISKKGTGKIYKTGKTSKHQASAPGQPPATASGELKGSIGHKVETGRTVVALLVGTWADHGIYTELGTKKMAPRPWLSVIFKQYAPKIKGKFATEQWHYGG
jgi:HK97 gp10 family phage protein